jgi:hypothetical protein
MIRSADIEEFVMITVQSVVLAERFQGVERAFRSSHAKNVGTRTVVLNGHAESALAEISEATRYYRRNGSGGRWTMEEDLSFFFKGQSAIRCDRA